MPRAYKPYYPLKDVKALLRCNHVVFTGNALEKAHNDFGWGGIEITKVLLKLNDRWHRDNPQKNHFYKTEAHRFYPNTKMDYYKVINGLEGNKIYTHFCIHNLNGQLIVSSFKELIL